LISSSYAKPRHPFSGARRVPIGFICGWEPACFLFCPETHPLGMNNEESELENKNKHK